MSVELVMRLRKQREFEVPVDKFVFIVRRPTDAEFYDLAKRGGELYETASRFVVGWKGVTENDVAGGGGTDPLPFDAGLWREWCADRIDFWEPLTVKIVDAYELHKKTLEEATANFSTGSS